MNHCCSKYTDQGLPVGVISGTGIAGVHHMNLFSWQKLCTFDRNAQCNARYSQFISAEKALLLV